MSAGNLKPRQHAAVIMALDTREERREYLDTKVPEHLRELVATHVKIQFERRAHERRKEKQRSLA